MRAGPTARDPIAPYNLGNIRLAQGAHDQAILAYQQALARDAGFVEARYNLAQALEAAGKPDAAAGELTARSTPTRPTPTRCSTSHSCG